jgi:large subunit ribosomal protein L18e
VNVSKLSEYVKEGGYVVVPDKVLGAGSLSHKVNVGAVAYSASAKKAIIASGGKALDIAELAKLNATGKDVVIIK